MQISLGFTHGEISIISRGLTFAVTSYVMFRSSMIVVEGKKLS